MNLWVPVGDQPVIFYPVVFGWEFSPDLPPRLTVSFLQLVAEEGREREALFGDCLLCVRLVLGALLMELRMV